MQIKLSPVQILTFGQCAGVMVTAILPMFFSRWMSVEEFASFRFASFALALVSIVGSLGLDSSMYALVCRNQISPRKFSKSSLFWGMTCGALISALTALSLSFLPDSIRDLLTPAVFAPLACCLIFMMATAHIEHLLVVVHRYKHSAVIAALTSLVLSASCLIGLWIQASAATILWSMAAAYALRLIATIGFHHLHSQEFKWLDLALLKLQFKNGIGAGISNILMSFQRFDRLAVAGRFSATDFADYSVGSFEIPLSRSYCESRHQIATVAAMGSNDFQSLRIWWHHVTQSIRIILPMAAIAAVFAPQIIVMLFGATYEDAAPIFSLACLSIVIFAMDPELLLRSKSYTRSLTVIHGLSLLGFFSVFLLPVIRPLDILLARLLTELGACLAKYLVLYLGEWFTAIRSNQATTSHAVNPSILSSRI